MNLNKIIFVCRCMHRDKLCCTCVLSASVMNAYINHTYKAGHSKYANTIHTYTHTHTHTLLQMYAQT